MPLQYCGGGFCVDFAVDGRLYRGVLDTGSPFALVSTCRGKKCGAYCRAWGCASSATGQATGYPDSSELFAAGRADISWRRGDFRLGAARLGSLSFGVLREVVSLGGNGGGAFFGLVRGGPRRRQPSFLAQTAFRSIGLDFRPGSERLSLSPAPLALAPEDAVPLVDLRRFGAPLEYYAVEVQSLQFGEEELAGLGRIVAVIDTGTTGLALPEELYQVFDASRRIQSSRLGFRRASAVQIRLATGAGGSMALRLRQGPVPVYAESFDVVTPVPQPEGLSPEASGLWSEERLGDPAGLQVHGRVARLAGTVPATIQGERVLGRGGSFSVRLRSCEGGACRLAVGLAPDPVGGILGEAAGTCGYAAEGFSLVGGADVAAEGPRLKVGDVVECGLASDGAAFWRVNGQLVGPVEFEGRGALFPTVALAGAEVELLGDWGSFREPKRNADRPVVVFLGLGFLLGRRVAIDAVARKASFSDPLG